MSVFKRKIDPYKWRHERVQGRRLFMISRGVLPGLVAGVAYAAIMLLFGSSYSVYTNGIVFMIVTSPIYLFLSYVVWESNEEAFAAWVLQEHQRLKNLRRRSDAQESFTRK